MKGTTAVKPVTGARECRIRAEEEWYNIGANSSDHPRGAAVWPPCLCESREAGLRWNNLVLQ